MESWRTEVNVSLLFSQFSSPSSQFFVSRFAVNHDRSINKDSKSSNQRSLKQHTLAESISFCCFCSVREIGRFIILICRCLLHRSTRLSTRFSFSWSSHTSIFALLSSHIFCFRIYFFTSIALALRFSALTMINQLFTFQSMNFFAMSIDKRNEIVVSRRNLKKRRK